MITAPALTAIDRISHGFFGRAGGVSDGLYASRNCGLGSDDDADRVRQNRTLVARDLGSPGPDLLTCHQWHSADVVVVTEPWSAAARPKADALVTDRPGLVIAVLTADCAPILLCDRQAGVVGAAHAGWRGALGGIVAATVAAMADLGAETHRITAAVGPTIARDSYEVGPDFRAAFERDSRDGGRFFHTPNGKVREHFDLPAFVLSRLAALGVAAEWTGGDTLADPGRFFSHRHAAALGAADYGRQAAAIMLRPGQSRFAAPQNYS